jgi:dipeptidase
VPHTLNVVGNVNELGISIVETTFGGRGDLDGQGTGAIMSYGDLIWTTLSRATSARDAIRIMDELTQSYGYESSGESFGVGDSDEVWLMEMVSKGKYGKGSVWVASRIPDGYVGSTANQARTEKFDHNDPENVLFAADVVTFAKQIGAYPPGGSDEDFSFREAYDPITFGGARFGEQRVWTMFNPICGGCVDRHLDFAQGYNLSNSMPLFVPAAQKLSLMDVVHVMRDHAEGTWFDPSGLRRPDVGGESGHSPYRQRPLTWAFGNDTYLNERTVGIQQSGWAFIAQLRGWLPPPLKAVTWFAPDDAATSPRVPVYGGATRIPAAFGHRVGQTPGGGVPYAPAPVDGFTMNLDSAFWVWNLVGNVAFSERYSTAYPDIVAQVDAHQARMIDAAAAMEKDFAALWAVDPAAAVELMTRFGETNGMDMFQRCVVGGAGTPADSPPPPPNASHTHASRTLISPGPPQTTQVDAILDVHFRHVPRRRRACSRHNGARLRPGGDRKLHCKAAARGPRNGVHRGLEGANSKRVPGECSALQGARGCAGGRARAAQIEGDGK